MKTALLPVRRNLFSGMAFAAAALMMVSLFTGTAEARGKKKAAPEIHKITLVSATPSSVTIKEEAGTKTLSISSVTEVTVNGQKATIADLQPGMVVSLTLRDPANASKIAATSP
jgi:hypothetical protein